MEPTLTMRNTQLQKSHFTYNKHSLPRLVAENPSDFVFPLLSSALLWSSNYWDTQTSALTLNVLTWWRKILMLSPLLNYLSPKGRFHLLNDLTGLHLAHYMENTYINGCKTVQQVTQWDTASAPGSNKQLSEFILFLYRAPTIQATIWSIYSWTFTPPQHTIGMRDRGTSCMDALSALQYTICCTSLFKIVLHSLWTGVHFLNLLQFGKSHLHDLIPSASSNTVSDKAEALVF